MADEAGGPRYSEKQAAAILRRAVERSAAAGAEGSSGISLAEMERIAGEIGIDPQHVRAAAAEVSGSRATATPGVIDLEQVVAVELSEEAWDSILAELRRVFGDAGTTSAVGRAREWDLRQDTTSVHASLISRNGSTKVHLMSNYSSAMGVGWVLWGIFSFMAVFLATVAGGKIGGLDQALINFLIAGGISGGAFLGIRAATQSWHRKQQERMGSLLQRVTGLVREYKQSDVAQFSAAETPAVSEAAPPAVEPEQQVIARLG